MTGVVLVVTLYPLWLCLILGGLGLLMGTHSEFDTIKNINEGGLKICHILNQNRCTETILDKKIMQ